MELKKKQHYVSQFYLKAWANTQERLKTVINNNIVPMKTKEVAHQNYFYRLDGISKKAHAYLTKFNNNHTPTDMTADIQQVIDTSLAIGVTKHSDTSHKREFVRTNMIEDIYCTAEFTAKDVIVKLLDHDLTSFNFTDFINFVRFCTLQMTRTSAVRNNSHIEQLKNYLESGDIEFNDVFIITNNLIIPEKLAMNLIHSFYHLEIIENRTSLPFITTDNPAININPNPKDKKLQLYFPLSPQKAALLTPKDISDALKEKILESDTEIRYFLKITSETNIDRIHALNTALIKKSERFIFAQQDEELLIYSNV